MILKLILMDIIQGGILYNLIRKKDGIKNQSMDIIWIEFDKFGRFKEKYNEPAIGRSLLMSPFNNFFTWMTTPIIEIIDKEENYLYFKTKNNEYILTKE
jgi:hypothetical protein